MMREYIEEARFISLLMLENYLGMAISQVTLHTLWKKKLNGSIS